MTATTKDTQCTKMEFEGLSKRVIGCAVEVYRHFGPGLLESACEQCLAHERSHNGIAFQLQPGLPVQDKDAWLNCGCRIEISVENQLMVEVQSLEEIKGLHDARRLTCINVARMKNG